MILACRMAFLNYLNTPEAVWPSRKPAVWDRTVRKILHGA